MTEECWKSVLGYEDRYEVSDQGRVRNIQSGYILKPVLNSGGYSTVSLFNGRSKTWLIHRLVLRSFVGEPPLGHEGCHANGDRTDARLANLRWDTHSANMRDAVAMGNRSRPPLSECGKGHPLAGDNLYVTPDGARRCRECRSAAWNAFWVRNRDARNARRAELRRKRKAA